MSECVICGSHNNGDFVKDNRKRKRFVCNECWSEHLTNKEWFNYWLNKN